MAFGEPERIFPRALPFPGDDPGPWGVTINDIPIRECIWSISNVKGGMRFDKQPALGFHFPQLVAQGYELCTFSFSLEAYDDLGVFEMMKVLDSIFPVISEVTSVKKPLKVSRIKHSPMNVRGMTMFVPTDFSPFPEVKSPGTTDECVYVGGTLTLFSPAKQMGLGNFGVPNAGYSAYQVDNASPTNYSPSAGDPFSAVATAAQY